MYTNTKANAGHVLGKICSVLPLVSMACFGAIFFLILSSCLLIFTFTSALETQRLLTNYALTNPIVYIATLPIITLVLALQKYFTTFNFSDRNINNLKNHQILSLPPAIDVNKLISEELTHNLDFTQTPLEQQKQVLQQIESSLNYQLNLPAQDISTEQNKQLHQHYLNALSQLKNQFAQQKYLCSELLKNTSDWILNVSQKKFYMNLCYKDLKLQEVILTKICDNNQERLSVDSLLNNQLLLSLNCNQRSRQNIEKINILNQQIQQNIGNQRQSIRALTTSVNASEQRFQDPKLINGLKKQDLTVQKCTHNLAQTMDHIKEAERLNQLVLTRIKSTYNLPT